MLSESYLNTCSNTGWRIFLHSPSCDVYFSRDWTRGQALIPVSSLLPLGCGIRCRPSAGCWPVGLMKLASAFPTIMSAALLPCRERCPCFRAFSRRRCQSSKVQHSFSRQSWHESTYTTWLLLWRQLSSMSSSTFSMSMKEAHPRSRRSTAVHTRC